jgi:hypothetical protein
MDYDSFECDENLTIILFNTIAEKQKKLELYAIKWEFDTSKLKLNKLQRYDQQAEGVDGEVSSSTYRSGSSKRSRQVKLNGSQGSDQNKKKSFCQIF